MSDVVMSAGDSISAKLAKCYVTINGRRYNAFNLIKFEAKFTKKKVKVPILGQTGAGNKATGWEGTWSATMHYNTSIYRQMMLDYKNTGADVYFEIQVSNEDPTSAAGKQTVTFLGCNIDGGVLAKFDASSDDPLDEDVDGTFENFEMPDKFKLLPGM
ncbi:phage tail tube protein [[Clostridium] polysaccharolyticum]|uniref:Phage tail tube protein n=1 Tax=[Clostridium] polysaccharolyticum TaxID=29364 RepID=A0A1H9YHS4_9FIRM|nr:phage tail tube protein [[Clostridium] polysaccharolyticum]SES68573.1 Phage tail tube protein [[Clostridium] polysaccharolyticum]